MNYISIDIETTGLDPETCQILEIGAVIDNDELPTFQCFIDNGLIVGEPFALQMNQQILKSIADGDGKILKPEEVVPAFLEWLYENDLVDRTWNYIYNFKNHLTFAGKNVGTFDLQFLKKLPGWDRVKVRHRTIDPGMLYWNPVIDDCNVPSMTECLRRAGLDDTVSHRAVDDALAVIELIRRA